jgi:SRSO17 transposase
MNVLDAAGVERLTSFFGAIGAVLGTASRRESFATYALGLLSDAERKSVEPISARACGDPRRADAAHQRLLHFVGNGDWGDHEVRLAAAEHGVAAMTIREKIEAWILDDTGFLKQGKHSVGVQRQYTGSAGKITNCQVGTSLTIATPTEQLPIDFELYLPASWTDDPVRCRKAGVPGDLIFKTKPELALDMIRRAVAAGIPPGVVLGDAAYGASSDFRRGIRELDLHYSLGIDPKTTVWEVGDVVNRGGAAISVRDLAKKLKAKGRFRRCTWRAGTKADLTARFAMRRVFPCREQSRDVDERESVWLLIEWRDGEDEPANYFFSSLPKTARRKRLVRITMQRWRTERAYEDMKGELGLDHYEGRGFRGWHHHVSVVLCCYAFVVSERVRHFPPSARGAVDRSPNILAA